MTYGCSIGSYWSRKKTAGIKSLKIENIDIPEENPAEEIAKREAIDRLNAQQVIDDCIEHKKFIPLAYR
ncbi:MAG: hypothetical protein WC356_01840 [Candidatus Micrarchaeia archaeon]|jgi:hypothetical protein